MTLNAMQPDILVVRHPDAGAVQLLSEKVTSSVINAGDGPHEHPTQALLDALTILRRKKVISGLKVAICGDILHSRVVVVQYYTSAKYTWSRSKSDCPKHFDTIRNRKSWCSSL